MQLVLEINVVPVYEKSRVGNCNFGQYMSENVFNDNTKLGFLKKR